MLNDDPILEAKKQKLDPLRHKQAFKIPANFKSKAMRKLLEFCRFVVLKPENEAHINLSKKAPDFDSDVSIEDEEGEMEMGKVSFNGHLPAISFENEVAAWQHIT